MIEAMRELFEAGGWVMWPLALLSVVSVALSLERALFWWGMKRAGRGNRGGRGGWVRRMTGLLAAGHFDEARAVASEDGTVYGRFVLSLLSAENPAATGSKGKGTAREPDAGAGPVSGAIGAGAVEEVRPAVERWSVTMSTIITAAPMLGILGTVLGIIESFQLLGQTESAVTDPAEVAGGIAEALITTAFGLIVALVTLFPYNIFRAAADRCFGRLETLFEAVIRDRE